MMERRPSPNRSAQLAPWLLPVERQARGEGDVVETFRHRSSSRTNGFEAVHARAAVAQDEIEVAVVVHVAEVAAHGAPAAIETQLADLQRERAVAVVVINHAAACRPQDRGRVFMV